MSKPLAGLRVVVTRAAHQAEDLAAPLRELGAQVILLPLIGIAPPPDPEPLRLAARNTEAYDWIIFTSANAVNAFAAQLEGPAPAVKARVAAIGPATREAAEERGFPISLMPERYVAESLLEAFAGCPISGSRILIPSAAVTRDVIPAELRKRGARVDVVEAYRNALPNETREQAPLVFRDPYPDWALFASPSAIDNLIQLVGLRGLRQTRIASIGPVTSAAIRKHGLTVDAEPGQHTVEGLVEVVRAVALCKIIE